MFLGIDLLRVVRAWLYNTIVWGLIMRLLALFLAEGAKFQPWFFVLMGLFMIAMMVFYHKIVTGYPYVSVALFSNNENESAGRLLCNLVVYRNWLCVIFGAALAVMYNAYAFNSFGAGVFSFPSLVIIFLIAASIDFYIRAGGRFSNILYYLIDPDKKRLSFRYLGDINHSHSLLDLHSYLYIAGHDHNITPSITMQYSVQADALRYQAKLCGEVINTIKDGTDASVYYEMAEMLDAASVKQLALLKKKANQHQPDGWRW